MTKSLLTSKQLPSMINFTPVLRFNLLEVYIQIKYYKQCRTMFGQLQDIEEECRQLIEGTAREREEEVEMVRREVKRRRKEIEEMKREVLGLKTEVKKKKHQEEQKKKVRTEIDKVRSFAGKEKTQSKKMQDIVERAEQKSKIQQRRMTEIQAEQAILAEFQACLQSRIQFSKQYAALKQKLNVVSTQLLSQKMGNNLTLQRRKEQLKALQSNHTNIDEQLTNLTQQITIQQQIINQISKEGDHQDHSFDILNKEQQTFFKRKQELDIWERHELQGLIQKRGIQKEKERKIGSIWRQRLSTQSHKERPVINRSLTNSYQQPAKYNKSSELLFISSERMKQLQKNKRIRTRYTQPRTQQTHQPQTSPSSHPRTSEQPESSPSILTIYEQFKKQRMPNPQSIKLLRTHNKKRSLNQGKGTPLQLQQFD